MLGTWRAGRMMGGISVWGGQIILTPSQVIFTPLFLASVKKRIPLAQIAHVESRGKPRLFSPPQVVITLKNQHRYTFGFVVNIWTPNFRAQNAQVRDTFLQQLQTARNVAHESRQSSVSFFQERSREVSNSQSG